MLKMWLSFFNYSNMFVHVENCLKYMGTSPYFFCYLLKNERIFVASKRVFVISKRVFVRSCCTRLRMA